MGIQSLNKFLKENAPRALKTINLTEFEGTRVAIDGTCIAYKMMSRSVSSNVSSIDMRINPKTEIDSFKQESECIRHVIQLGTTFASFGIVPIFIFDGTSIPAKAKTQKKRRESKKKDYERMVNLEEELSQTPISERKDEKIDELVKLKSGQVYVSRDSVNKIKEILTDLGFPVISAKGEAEKTCCMLAIEGKVAAVYSPDTDCIAIGAPLVIQGFIGGRDLSAKCVVFETILEELNMTSNEFLDLCILGGSDFNENLPGIQVKTAYNKFKKFPPGKPKMIENLLLQEKKSEEDIKNLDYEYCRSEVVFGYINSLQTIDGYLQLEINRNAINEEGLLDKLESLHLRDTYFLVQSAFTNIKGKTHHGGAERIISEGRIVAETPKVRFVIKRSTLIPSSPEKESTPTKIDQNSSSIAILMRNRIKVFE